MRWLYIPRKLNVSINCEVFPIYTYENTSSFRGGGHLVSVSGSYYTPASQSLIVVDEGLVSESITIPNPVSKSIDTVVAQREQLTKLGSKVIMFTDRFDGVSGGVRMLSYETGSWTDEYNWLNSTNAILQNFITGSEFWVVATEVIRRYDFDLNYLGGFGGFGNGRNEIYKNKMYRFYEPGGGFQYENSYSWLALDTGSSVPNVNSVSHMKSDDTNTHMYIVSGSGDILRYSDDDKLEFFLNSTGSVVSNTFARSQMKYYNGKFLYVTDSRDLVAFTTSSQELTVIHTFDENQIDMDVNSSGELIFLGYTDDSTPSNLYVLTCSD